MRTPVRFNAITAFASVALASMFACNVDSETDTDSLGAAISFSMKKEEKLRVIEDAPLTNCQSLGRTGRSAAVKVRRSSDDIKVPEEPATDERLYLCDYATDIPYLKKVVVSSHEFNVPDRGYLQTWAETSEFFKGWLREMFGFEKNSMSRLPYVARSVVVSGDQLSIQEQTLRIGQERTAAWIKGLFGALKSPMRDKRYARAGKVVVQGYVTGPSTALSEDLDARQSIGFSVVATLYRSSILDAYTKPDGGLVYEPERAAWRADMYGSPAYYGITSAPAPRNMMDWNIWGGETLRDEYTYMVPFAETVELNAAALVELAEVSAEVASSVAALVRLGWIAQAGGETATKQRLLDDYNERFSARGWLLGTYPVLLPAMTANPGAAIGPQILSGDTTIPDVDQTVGDSQVNELVEKGHIVCRSYSDNPNFHRVPPGGTLRGANDDPCQIGAEVTFAKCEQDILRIGKLGLQKLIARELEMGAANPNPLLSLPLLSIRNEHIRIVCGALSQAFFFGCTQPVGQKLAPYAAACANGRKTCIELDSYVQANRDTWNLQFVDRFLNLLKTWMSKTGISDAQVFADMARTFACVDGSIACTAAGAVSGGN